LSTTKKSFKDEVKESRSFALALIIIAGYIVFFGVVMYQNPTNYEGWQTLNATYGVVVATVVGYYFGQKPAQQALQSAQESKTMLKKETEKNVGEIEEGIEMYREILKFLEGKDGKT